MYDQSQQENCSAHVEPGRGPFQGNEYGVDHHSPCEQEHAAHGEDSFLAGGERRQANQTFPEYAGTVGSHKAQVNQSEDDWIPPSIPPSDM